MAKGITVAYLSKVRRALAVLCVATFVGQAVAADLFTVRDADYCAVAGTSNLILTENIMI